MPIPVQLKDIIEHLEMSSESITYYLDKRTGQVEMVTEDDTVALELEEDEPLDDQPGWMKEAISKAREIENDEGEHFVSLPDKFDLNDYKIMEGFSRSYPNKRVSVTLLDAIRGKGAFRRFKELVHEFSLENKWNEFQRHAYEEIAVEWLEDNDIPYTRGDETEVGGEI